MKKTIYGILFLIVVILAGCTNTTTPTETIFESTSASREEVVTETTAEETTDLAETTNTDIPETEKITFVESSTVEQISTEATMPVETTTFAETEVTTSAPVILQGYLFEAGGIQIGMHEEAAGVLSALGEAEACFETPSCAFQGMDKQYTYGGYMLTTYEENGMDYVYDIYFLNESVNTPEGIHIGSTFDEMVAAYGDGYTEDFGMYTYIKERSKLQFLIENGVITSIDYTAVTD